MKVRLGALLSLAGLMACQAEEIPDEGLMVEALNEQLAVQEVIIKAPGFPSKEEALVMVLEDPDLPENLEKSYHPAEKLGWRQMLEYARAFEKAGVIRVHSGTFAERDYFDKPFTFTGHRLHIGTELQADTVILPSMGKVGFKLGRVCVKRLLSRSAPSFNAETGQAEVTVSFEAGLCQLKSWASEEIVSLSGVRALFNEPLTLTLGCDLQHCVIVDEQFRSRLQKPLLAF